MTKQEYINIRTEYYRQENKGVKLSLKLAKECAEDDYKIYIEKYGKESLNSR